MCAAVHMSRLRLPEPRRPSVGIRRGVRRNLPIVRNPLRIRRCGWRRSEGTDSYLGDETRSVDLGGDAVVVVAALPCEMAPNELVASPAPVCGNVP